MLNPKHHEAVIKMFNDHTLPRYQHKKICKICKNNRWIEFDINGKLIMCPRCINRISAFEAWKDYIKEHPDANI